MSNEEKDPLTSGSNKQQRDEQRIETNKTDPQKTELKGFLDPEEPFEEEGTINPLTGKPRSEDE